MKKIYIIIAFIIFFNTSNSSELVTLDSINTNMELITDAKSAIMIEASTGQVLYEKSAYTKRAPASMTKIMTMDLILNAINDGVFNLNDVHTVSANAASMGGSQIYLETGEKMPVEELLKSIAISSANDSAVALAEKVAGNEANFIKMMNEQVSKLNLSDTNFMNPTGLPNDNHYSTAYDMAIMAKNLINTHDEDIIKYTSTYEDYIRDGKFWLVNTNQLVKFVNGVDGLKTGWTEEAGYCLTATMNLNGIRVIAVLMGSSSSSKRNQEITQLMQYGVSNFEKITLKSKDEIIENISNIRLSYDNVKITIEKDIFLVKNKGIPLKDSNIITFLEINCGNNSAGYVEIYYDNKLYETVNLVFERNLELKNFYSLFFDIMKEIMN